MFHRQEQATAREWARRGWHSATLQTGKARRCLISPLLHCNDRQRTWHLTCRAREVKKSLLQTVQDIRIQLHELLSREPKRFRYVPRFHLSDSYIWRQPNTDLPCHIKVLIRCTLISKSWFHLSILNKTSLLGFLLTMSTTLEKASGAVLERLVRSTAMITSPASNPSQANQLITLGQKL